MAHLVVGLLLFPGFEVLDAAGPIEILNVLSVHMEASLELCVISHSPNPVSPGLVGSAAGPKGAFTNQQLYLPTHTMDNAPALDLLIVPGGRGTRDKEMMEPYVEYIRKVSLGYDEYRSAKYMFSICTGSALFASAGVLDGRNATSNKRSWAWATSHGPKTHWIAKARWVEDAGVWTTSGVSAGIDGMLAFAASIYGEDVADRVSHIIEHDRIKDANNDPWAAKNGCEDVLPLDPVKSTRLYGCTYPRPNTP